MNKLLLTVAALITAAGTAPVSAYALAGNASTQATAVRTGFVEIDPSELPQAVRYAIASRYASSSIEKAYANAGIRLYKITVPTLRERLWTWSNEVPARPSHKRKSPPRPQGKARRSPGETGPPAEGLFANRPFLYTIIAIFAGEKHYEKESDDKGADCRG